MEQQYPLMAVVNGNLSSISPLLVLVKDSTERDAITDEVPAGTIAYTAGATAVWQKDADGSWQDFEA